MIYFSHILYGFLIAYFSLISPGMLNMSVLKLRIERGRIESYKFAIGSAIVISIQASIALFFTDYLVKNPKIIELLRIAGVFVFFLLAIFFFFLSRKKIEQNVKTGNKRFILKGALLASLNMLSIPFYLATGLYLASKNTIVIEQFYIFLFAFGVLGGAISLFGTYIYFAKIISTKVTFLSKNINLILCLLFVALGILTLVKLYS